MLTTFGGSGSLLACRLVDILDLAGVVVPPNPGNVSAFGLLTVDVKNDYVQTAVAKHADLDHAAVADDLRRRSPSGPPQALDGEGFARDEHRYVRTVDLRYFGQAFEVRVPAPDGERRRGVRRRASPTRFHDEHRALYGYDFRDDPRQQVEWVNLRVTGVGPITRPELRELAPPTASATAPSAPTGTAPGLLRRRAGLRRHRRLLAPRPARRRRVAGPADHRGVRLDRPGPPRLHRRASTRSATS